MMGFVERREKSSDDKSVVRQIALKKTNKNTIATNFVSEELNSSQINKDKSKMMYSANLKSGVFMNI